MAYIIIKEESFNIGFPLGPVLMLSYKNHALDEFLCDVVEFSVPKLTQGKLIRSGKPENPKLFPFSEKNSSEEVEAEKILKYRVDIIRKAQKISREWRDCAIHLETRFSVNSKVRLVYKNSILFIKIIFYYVTMIIGMEMSTI